MKSTEIFSAILFTLPLLALPAPFLRFEEWRCLGMRLYSSFLLLVSLSAYMGWVQTDLSPRMQMLLLSYTVLQFSSILSLPRRKATTDVLLGMLVFSISSIAVIMAKTTEEFRWAFGLSLFTPFIASTTSKKHRIDSVILLLLAITCLSLFLGGQYLIGSNILWLGQMMIFGAALVRLSLVPFHLWLRRLVLFFPIQWAVLFFLSYPTISLFLQPTGMPAELHLSFLHLAWISSIYGATLAVAQKELRSTFYYLLLSFFGSVAVGLAASSDELALGGVVIFWLTMGLTLGGFGLIVEMIEARVGTINYSAPRGRLAGAPNLGGLFILFGLGSVGFPGLCAFIGTEVMLSGIFRSTGWAVLPVLLALSLNGITILRWYFHLFTGCNISGDTSLRLLPRETIAISLLLVIAISAGIFPKALFIVSQP